MSDDGPCLAPMRDGWDTAPARRPATATAAATMPRIHRLRLLSLGDGFAAGRDGDDGGEREYHPYGLLVWDGPRDRDGDAAF